MQLPGVNNAKELEETIENKIIELNEFKQIIATFGKKVEERGYT